MTPTSTPALPRCERRYLNIATDSSRWSRYVARPGDIIISTPPKAGTTWSQMICALLIFQRSDFEQPLERISPWLDFRLLDLDDVMASLEAQEHRRLIKTHTPLDGLPYFEEVTYVYCGRDPRDMLLSFRSHMGNVTDAARSRLAAATQSEALPPPADINEHFGVWATPGPEGPATDFTLESILHHTRTFWRHRDLPNIHLLHYADLKADLAGQMRILADRLGIRVDSTAWPELVNAATFESMKRGADRLAPGAAIQIMKDNGRFFDKGESGRWRGVLGPRNLELYESVLGQSGPAPMIDWLHHGSQGAQEAGTA